MAASSLSFGQRTAQYKLALRYGYRVPGELVSAMRIEPDMSLSVEDDFDRILAEHPAILQRLFCSEAAEEVYIDPAPQLSEDIDTEPVQNYIGRLDLGALRAMTSVLDAITAGPQAIKITRDGWLIQAINSSSTTLLEIKLPNVCFERYDIESEEIFIAIHPSSIRKLCSAFLQREAISMKVDCERNRLLMSAWDNKLRWEHKLASIEEVKAFPKLPFELASLNHRTELTEKQVRDLKKALAVASKKKRHWDSYSRIILENEAGQTRIFACRNKWTERGVWIPELELLYEFKDPGKATFATCGFDDFVNNMKQAKGTTILEWQRAFVRFSFKIADKLGKVTITQAGTGETGEEREKLNAEVAKYAA